MVILAVVQHGRQPQQSAKRGKNGVLCVRCSASTDLRCVHCLAPVCDLCAVEDWLATCCRTCAAEHYEE